MGEIERLHCVGNFASFHAAVQNVKHRHLVFRVLSRAAATFYQYVVVRHRVFPYPLFRLPLEPELKDQILERCDSSYDAYTESFMKGFGEDICSDTALLELAVLVKTGATNIVPRECGHSHIRRMIMAKSTHVTRTDLATVNAEFILAACRTRERALVFPLGSRQVRKVRSKKQGVRHASDLGPHERKRLRPKRAGGGGAWRAYVSAHCRGRVKASFRALAEEYKQLSADERAVYVALGVQATRARALGGVSFGQVARAVSRAVERDSVHRRAISMDTAASQLARMSFEVAIEGGAIGAVIKKSRADRVLMRRLERERVFLVAERMAVARQTVGVAQRDQAIMAIPCLAISALGLTAEPKRGAVSSIAHTCTIGQEIPRMLGLWARQPRGHELLHWLASDLQLKGATRIHDEQEHLPAEPR